MRNPAQVLASNQIKTNDRCMCVCMCVPYPEEEENGNQSKRVDGLL
jgi:hypothetical protein